MPDIDLEAAVLRELTALRKNRSGVTVHTIASARTICRLLGSGDPFLAYSRLQHALLDATADRTVRATAASLGFSSDGETHLDRLEDAGAGLGGIDQRQARRLSDAGLKIIAKLIATNWVVEAVPVLTFLVSANISTFEIVLTTEKPSVIEMSEPDIEIWVGDKKESPSLEWVQSHQNGVDVATIRRAISVPRSGAETSVVIVWRGELWPKFTLNAAELSNLTVESLGNKIMVRLMTPT